MIIICNSSLAVVGRQLLQDTRGNSRLEQMTDMNNQLAMVNTVSAIQSAAQTSFLDAAISATKGVATEEEQEIEDDESAGQGD